MKILILCLPGIGDALMATPMIKVLRKELPDAQIDVACMFDGVRYVFSNNPNVDKVFLLSLYKQNRLIAVKRAASLRREKYDVSILCFPGYRKDYHIVQWLVGAKKRIAHAFKKGHFSEMNFLDTDLVPFDEAEHHVINNLNLLKPLGIDWQKNYKKEDFKYDLILDKEDALFGKKYIQDLGWEKEYIVGFHPGSISSPMGLMRRWPVEKFAQLAKDLIKDGMKIMVFAGPEEAEVGDKLVELVSDSSNLHLVSGLKFNQSVGALSQVNVLVSNDNGFSHLANGLGVKGVVLMGPTRVEWTAPYNSKICIPIRKAKFPPWFRNDIKADWNPKGVEGGMDAIEVSDVVEAVESFKKK